MSAEIVNDLGKVIIEDSVIASIAGIAAMQSYGIVGMASKNAKDGIFELLRFDFMSKGIDVEVVDNSINLDLHVILEYGVKISVVAQNIIDNVKFNVESITGLRVDNINVLVQGIRVDKK
ncbi:MAG: Asp23/Gls24 family envelope stress response protein [Tissierellia bacterium]|nr:Asp23/Gls24 family envelope stress response protein [Tissierellia bacterium]